MIWVNSVEKLEKTIEKNIKDSYSNWEYVRCYNLMKLMTKVNSKNPVLLKYVVKVDEWKVLKQRKRWIFWKTNWFLNIFKSPRLYVTFALLLLLWRIK